MQLKSNRRCPRAREREALERARRHRRATVDCLIAWICLVRTAIHVVHWRHIRHAGWLDDRPDDASHRQRGNRERNQEREYETAHFHSSVKIADLPLPRSNDEFESKEL